MSGQNLGEIIVYQSEDGIARVSVLVENGTVWLNKAQMADLFQKDRSNIGRHIHNIFAEKELDEKSNVQKMHIANADRPVQFYNLDVIISVGYRVKSQRGTEFRRWANKVLKDYIIKGYAINDKRLQALQKTVEIQTRMLANTMDLEQEDVLKAVSMYKRSSLR